MKIRHTSHNLPEASVIQSEENITVQQLLVIQYSFYKVHLRCLIQLNCTIPHQLEGDHSPKIS